MHPAHCHWLFLPWPTFYAWLNNKLHFSNTSASRLMKLHTHICHDAPCPLPSAITDFYLLFSNTKTLRLMKLYTHICHDTPCLYWPSEQYLVCVFTSVSQTPSPLLIFHTHISHDISCPLPWSFTGLDLLFMPAWTMLCLCKIEASTLMKPYKPLLWHTLPTALSCYWPWPTFHTCLKNVLSLCNIEASTLMKPLMNLLWHTLLTAISCY